jgi:hypothetical protein
MHRAKPDDEGDRASGEEFLEGERTEVSDDGQSMLSVPQSTKQYESLDASPAWRRVW